MMLSNQSAAVTGGASGLGREIARTFAGEIARVMVLDLVIEAARLVAIELPAVKRSYGHENGPDSLREFTQTKAVWVKTEASS